MTVELDRGRIEEVVRRAADRLSGDWILLGGALVALWVEPRRTTEDVDLVSIGGSAEDRLALMNLASELGLPIEAVNSAADFFVRRIAGWRDELEPFVRGTSAVIYRPSVTLFVLLKAGRLSDQDLDDCIAVIGKARQEGLAWDPGRVRSFIDGLAPSADPDHQRRRSTLLSALTRDPS